MLRAAVMAISPSGEADLRAQLEALWRREPPAEILSGAQAELKDLSIIDREMCGLERFWSAAIYLTAISARPTCAPSRAHQEHKSPLQESAS